MKARFPLAVLLGLSLLSADVLAADLPADCPAAADAKSKSRTLNQMSTLMVSLLTLQGQGESNFKPAYAPPAGACVRERFAAGGVTVTAIQSAVDEGKSSLKYRFTTDGAEAREVLVLYDATTSVATGKSVYFVIETRNGNISYYEMYRDPPAYDVVKTLVTGILDGSSKALATVRWPPGAKEPVIDAMDSKRLK
ncbi:MAG TPA: hypothetical protein VMF52_22150 [Steroidobacteraceae bacterium]|nr:hypothetical protein [Steroidobacteraceae bacterium]